MSTLQRFAAIEKKLDNVINFKIVQDPDTGKFYDDEASSTGTKIAAGIAGASAVGAAGYGAHKAHAAIKDRMGGMNATRAAGVPRAGYLAAAGSVGKDVLAAGKARGASLLERLKGLAGRFRK
jgi:hypothetical protein